MINILLFNSGKQNVMGRYIKIFYLLVSLFVYSTSSCSQNTKQREASTTTSYSILQHTGKYTFCFDQLINAFNNTPSTQIVRNIFRLDSAVVTDKNLEKQQFYSLLYQKRPLTLFRLKALATFLNRIEQYVYTYTSKVVTDPVLLKQVKKFTIVVDTAEIDLGQPDEDTHTLLFPTGIIKNILDISVSRLFNEDYMKDSVTISDTDNPYGFLTEDRFIKDYQTYYEWVTNNEKFTLPCLPVFHRNDFLEILNNPTFIRKNLTARERLELVELKKIINKKGFESQLLLPDASTEEVNCFYVMMSLVDYNKIPADLVKLNKKVNALRELMEKEDELPGFDEDYTGEYFEDQFQYLIISNYLSLELYKYFTFLIAHEAYHYWFAPGEIGQRKEYEADKFATMIYLNLFTDATFQAAMNFQKQMETKMTKEAGVNFMNAGKTAIKTDEQSTSPYSELFQPFLAPPVFKIFEDVYIKTEFYEKHDAFHPPMKDRIEKMREISDKKADEVLDSLNSYFSNKENYIIKNNSTNNEKNPLCKNDFVMLTVNDILSKHYCTNTFGEIH
jgi:hypothetical protein